MSRLVAAVDDSAATAPVLALATWLAGRFDLEVDPDLVVLAWGGDLSGGRAAVMKGLLARTTTPLVLLSVVEGGEER